MNETAGTPLPMNSTPMHPKLKLSLSFSDKTFIAGDNVCGALEMGSHGGGAGERGKELGIGSMMVEMWGVEGVLHMLYARRRLSGRRRAPFPRPHRQSAFPLLPTPVPGPRAPSVQCRPRASSTQHAAATRALLSGEERAIQLQFPHASAIDVAVLDHVRQRRPRSVRGPG